MEKLVKTLSDQKFIEQKLNNKLFNELYPRVINDDQEAIKQLINATFSKYYVYVRKNFKTIKEPSEYASYIYETVTKAVLNLKNSESLNYNSFIAGLYKSIKYNLESIIKRENEFYNQTVAYSTQNNSNNNLSNVDLEIELKKLDNLCDDMQKSRLKETINSTLNDLLELGRLTTKEIEIIRLHYGLVDGEKKTYVEIGNLYNLDREQIRRLCERALKKLRMPLYKNLTK